MRANMFRDAREQGIVRHESLDTAGGQAVEIAATVDCFSAAVSNEQGLCGVCALIEVLLEPFGSFCADKDGAVFLPLAANHKFAPFEVYMVAVEPN